MTSTLFTDPHGTNMQVFFNSNHKLIIKLSDTSIDNISTYDLDKDDLIALIKDLNEKLTEIEF